MQGVGANPPPAGHRPTFSPDGLWYWDGYAWKSAISPDGSWRWNGAAWVPNRPAGGGGAGTAVAVTIVAFVGVIFFVGLITVVVLYTMGNQIANVFSNVAAALNTP